METHIYDFQVRVLVTRDDNQYVAHALEMDLVAYGNTDKEAIEEVAALMRNQLSFAIEKGEEHLTDFRAPQEFFDEWEKAHAATLQGIATGKCAEIKMQAKAIVFGASDIKDMRKRLQTRKAFQLTPACA